VPPGNFANVAPRLRDGSMGAEQADDPEFQIGDGCLIDQAVGDTYARLVGLGPVFDVGHVKQALDSVHRLNYVEDLGEWTNYMRTYAVHGERGHIVLSYPKGLPQHPMPYWCEVWSFSGVRRNPYDEAECGHHYARAMASWGLIVGLTGFDYDGRHGVIKFADAKGPSCWFWSTGQAWGTLRQSGGSPGTWSAQLEVAYGSVRVERAIIGGSVLRPPTPGLLVAGATYDLTGEA
jgi:non-lysosomal glucosylceramidase